MVRHQCAYLLGLLPRVAAHCAPGAAGRPSRRTFWPGSNPSGRGRDCRRDTSRAELHATRTSRCGQALSAAARFSLVDRQSNALENSPRWNCFGPGCYPENHTHRPGLRRRLAAILHRLARTHACHMESSGRGRLRACRRNGDLAAHRAGAVCRLADQCPAPRNLVEDRRRACRRHQRRQLRRQLDDRSQPKPGQFGVPFRQLGSLLFCRRPTRRGPRAAAPRRPGTADGRQMDGKSSIWHPRWPAA